MDILLIGISNVARRRLIPELVRVEGLGRIHMASRRPEVDVALPAHRRGRFFQGYEKALAELPPCVAYISLPNHLHARWASRALEAGFHVIVDKPAFLTQAEMEGILEMAGRMDRCVAESTVWSFHPQVAVAREVFQSGGAVPKTVQATFSFPALPDDNFRNDPAMGGGCLNDLGPYAVSAARAFLAGDPEEVHCRVVDRHGRTGVDTAFAATAIFPGNRVFQGFFGFCTEYKNRLSLLGPGVSVDLDPAFSTPVGQPVDVVVRCRDATEVITVSPGDTFGVFVSEILRSIDAQDWVRWTETLERDASLLNRLANDAGVARNGSWRLGL